MASGRTAGAKASPPLAPSGTGQSTRATALASKLGSGPGLGALRPIPSQDSEGGGIEGTDVIHEGSHEGIDWQPPSISAAKAVAKARVLVIARLPARRTSP